MAQSRSAAELRPIFVAQPEYLLKGNLVVHVAARAAPGSGRGCNPPRRTRGTKFPASVVTAEIAAAPATAARRVAGAIEQRELAAKTLQHYFGRIAVLARLILPLSRLQRAFDVNLRAFLEILLGDPAQVLVEDYDPVPLGLFLALAGRLVFPGV